MPCCNDTSATALSQDSWTRCRDLRPRVSWYVDCDKIFVTYTGTNNYDHLRYDLYHFEPVTGGGKRMVIDKTIYDSPNAVFDCVNPKLLPNGYSIRVKACVGNPVVIQEPCGGCPPQTIYQDTCCKEYDTCNCATVCIPNQQCIDGECQDMLSVNITCSNLCGDVAPGDLYPNNTWELSPGVNISYPSGQGLQSDENIHTGTVLTNTTYTFTGAALFSPVTENTATPPTATVKTVLNGVQPTIVLESYPQTLSFSISTTAVTQAVDTAAAQARCTEEIANDPTRQCQYVANIRKEIKLCPGNASDEVLRLIWIRGPLRATKQDAINAAYQQWLIQKRLIIVNYICTVLTLDERCKVGFTSFTDFNPALAVNAAVVFTMLPEQASPAPDPNPALYTNSDIATFDGATQTMKVGAIGFRHEYVGTDRNYNIVFRLNGVNYSDPAELLRDSWCVRSYIRVVRQDSRTALYRVEGFATYACAATTAQMNHADGLPLTSLYYRRGYPYPLVPPAAFPANCGLADNSGSARNPNNGDSFGWNTGEFPGTFTMASGSRLCGSRSPQPYNSFEYADRTTFVFFNDATDQWAVLSYYNLQGLAFAVPGFDPFAPTMQFSTIGGLYNANVTGITPAATDRRVHGYYI